MKIISINYSADGYATPDSDALNCAKRAYNRGWDMDTSSELVIHAFRVLVKRKEIDYRKIQFTYNEEVLKIDENGDFNKQPEGFCDTYSKFLYELLD